MRNIGSLNLINQNDNLSVHWDLVGFEKHKKIYPRFNEADWALVKQLSAKSGAQPRHQSKWFNMQINLFLSKSSAELDYIISDDLKLVKLGMDSKGEKVRPVFLSRNTLDLLNSKTKVYAEKFSVSKSLMKRYLVKLAIDFKLS